MSKAQKQERNASNSPLPRLIDAMRRPEFYEHRPAEVELRQTHISCVFLAGDYVYKIKKPVRFSFLDYSTLDRRRHFCEEEVRLNRRLASGIYLGVVPIVRDGQGFALKEDGVPPRQGTIAEYAVKMHRLPDGRLLDALLTEGKVGKEDIHAITKKLISFYQGASADKASVYGSADFVRRKMAENLQEAECFIGRTIGEKEFNEIREYTDCCLAKHGDLLERRARQGRVREGHGDLRAEHICLIDDIVIFDCIEFNEELRTCDTASELAFLAMDLDLLGAPLLSQELITAYGEMAEDKELARLAPFYKCHRAMVRGKVESLKSLEDEVPEAERQKAEERARRYFHLAHSYATALPPPALIVVCGLVAAGKSTVARALGERTGFRVLRSDVVRKQLAHIPPQARVAAKYREALYSDEFTRLTYGALLDEAERCVRAGQGVILDATFKEQRYRRRALDLAWSLKVPILFLECRASEAEISRRLRERKDSSEEISDATWEIYLRQREEFTPLDEIPQGSRMIVETEAPIDAALTKATEMLCCFPVE